MGLNEYPSVLCSFSIAPEIRLRPSIRQNRPLRAAPEAPLRCSWLVSHLLALSSLTTGRCFKGEEAQPVRPASPRCPFPWGLALVGCGGFGDVQAGLRLSSPARLRNGAVHRLALPAAASCPPSGISFSLPLRSGQEPPGRAAGAGPPAEPPCLPGGGRLGPWALRRAQQVCCFPSISPTCSQ